jgi:hypothetical protein
LRGIYAPSAPLFSSEEAKDFRARWDAIQVSFVDGLDKRWRRPMFRHGGDEALG